MNRHMPSIASLADEIRDNQPLRESIVLILGGKTRIRVQSNSAELLVRLRNYFREFTGDGEDADIRIEAIETAPPELPLNYIVKEPDPGKTRIKEEYIDLPDGRIVRKRLTGMVFLFGRGVQLAAGPCLANDNQVVNFINNRFMERILNENGLLAHASGVCLDGHGVAIAGFSGTGKSTLSLRLLEGGFDFVSNDRLVLRRESAGINMYGIPKHPRVNPGTLLASKRLMHIVSDEDRSAFGCLPESERWNLEKKYDVYVHDVFGAGRFRLESALKGIIILTWKRTKEATSIRYVDFVSRTDLLEAFMKPVGLFFHAAAGTIPDFSPERYISTLTGRCPVFEISGGVNFGYAADFIRDFLLREPAND